MVRVGGNSEKTTARPNRIEIVAGSVQDRAQSVASRLPPRIRQHNLTLVAAGVAFYAFLALVPALVAFISIYGLVANPANVTQQVKDVASALPKDVQNFLVYQLTSIIHANRAGVSITLIVAIALALWSASGGMAALITGVHVAHEKDQPKSFVKNRGKALLLTFGAIVFLGILIFVIAALPPLLSNVGLGSGGRIVLGILRWPILAAVMVVGIGLLYRFSMKDGPRGWLGIVTSGAVVIVPCFDPKADLGDC
jgi:membrane protein